MIFGRARLAEQTLSYRRGLVLGLTMVGIVILIVFVLLLAFGALLSLERQKITALQETEDDQKKQIADLIQRIHYINKSTRGRTIDDLVAELVQKTKQLDEINAAAISANVEPSPDGIQNALSQLNTLQSIEESWIELVEAAEAADIPLTPKEIAEVLNAGREILNLDGRSVADVVSDNMRLNEEIEDQKGDNTNLSEELDKCKSIGDGLQRPRCIAPGLSKAISYLYDVDVYDDSFVLSALWPVDENHFYLILPGVKEFGREGKFNTKEFKIFICHIFFF